MSRQSLGFWEVFSIGVGGMIGGGIFAVLGLSIELADGATPIAFALAGAIAMLTAYSYAKLSSRFPSEGGTIEFIVRAYGQGLLSGSLNLMLFSAYIVMISLYTYAFSSYGASIVQEHYQTIYRVLAVAVIVVFTLTNMAGARVSGRVELFLVVFKLSILLFISSVSLKLVEWDRLNPSNWPPPTSIVAGSMIIFLAYEGFELIANAARDARNTTVLRKALYSSVLTVICVYVLTAVVASGALSLDELQRARDYALAILVEPVLGGLGFNLVVIAALASAGSAINATLYGSARVSYWIAKYGEAPEILERRIWRGAYEGLIIIAAISLVLVLATDLETISMAGSGAFLVIFAFINLAAYRLRDKTGANPIYALMGSALAMSALAILIYRMLVSYPLQLSVFAALAMGSVAIEYIYRKYRRRTIPLYIDRNLPERERIIAEWESLIPKVSEVVKEMWRDAEITVIGSLARGEIHRAGDIDILITLPRKPLKGEIEELIVRIEDRLGIRILNLLHIHIRIR